ncbi:MAG: capsular biosynthesis protein [Anaerolineae bacterium]|nr:capsular biosynthesis protein [Anaerolineae bacterium]
MTAVESLLAVALTLRGAEVHFWLCDEVLPACMESTIHQFPDLAEFVAHGPAARMCRRCWNVGRATYEPLGLPLHRYSQWVTSDEVSAIRRLVARLPMDEIPSYRLDGLAVGEHALAGALRFFARGTLTDEPSAQAVLRRYLHAALLTVYAARRLLDSQHFSRACFNHGIYVPQGILGEVARQRGLPVVNWIPAYRKRCFIFSHEDTYHHTLMNEPVSAWETMAWTAEREEEVMDYLKSRWYGTRDWIWFHDKPQEDLVSISRDFGIDFKRPTISLLTNVMWDAQLHYPVNAFPNMLDWVLKTIDYFARRPDLQLVIRVHPAEVRGGIPSRQPIVAEIERAYPTGLPPNVYVIPPDHQASTYAIALHSNAVVIYGTKTGVELTAFGIPVIVAGEAWIRNKGITFDARSQDEYFALLDRLPFPTRLDEDTRRRARMYAYHFFFRRMIPLSVVEPRAGWPRFALKIDRLAQLAPGSDPGLDVICSGILTGAPFVYPAETLAGNNTHA